MGHAMNDCDEHFSKEAHYSWVCPFDNLSCEKSVEGLRFGVCYYRGLACPRFDEEVDVFRCSDGLPCNKFVDGYGFGACLDKDFGGKLRICCGRFKVGWVLDKEHERQRMRRG